MLHYFIAGGIFMWGILLASICGLAVILEKAALFLTKEKKLTEEFKRKLYKTLKKGNTRPQRPAPLPGVPAGLLGQLLRFATVGVVSTLAYFLLYVVLRPVFGAQAANLSALVLTAVANTSANRLFTFGVRGRQGMLGHHATGLLAFLVALGLTSGSLAALHAWAPGVDRWVEIAVLAVANAAATGLRFLALRLAIARRA